MRTVFTLSALMLLILGSANAAELDNLLVNPGFEDGSAGWTANGDGFVVDTDRPHSGAKCIRLDKPEGTYWVGCMPEVTLDQR
ncbi:MAG: hypothetical protein J7M38_09195, partial [Armatimonadetes bacterium]|nr:hypothetical protein [Armatimonadota bacterium]